MILKHRAASFSPGRTATDLKDKWRNLHHAVQSGDRRARPHSLLSMHRAIINVFVNRYP